MTITPSPAVVAPAWNAPHPGGWSRSFRFGEWLGDPITPLFETLLLPALESSFWAALRRLTGMPTPRPTYVVVHGWYFTSLNFWPAHPIGWLWRIARHPRLMRVMLQFTPAFVDWALAPWIHEWRTVGVPRYHAIVERAAAEVDTLPPGALPPLIQRLGAAAGDYFAWIALVAGAGYKTEAPLARFYRKHLQSILGGSHQDLLAAPRATVSGADAHALHSLDWFHPTRGEVDEASTSNAEQTAPGGGVTGSPDSAEARARAVLAHQPGRLREFERLVTSARRYAALREEIVSSFTLAWPVLRRAALRLGAALVEAQLLQAAEQVFFLTASELTDALGSPTPLSDVAARRRQDWECRRTLTPPLRLGQAPATFSRGLDQLAADLSPELSTALLSADSQSVLRGQPVSSGRATGPARIIRGPAEFHRLQPGDVLVAPTTAPAWTPLFARAAAVVTDTGSVLAHTSVVAREYGIPAVVSTGNATALLQDGHLITVDGTTGTIERAEKAVSPAP